MNTETYVHEEFLGQLGSAWDDAGVSRTVNICPVVLRAEDQKDKDDLIIVYGRNGDGEFQEDVSGMIVTEIGYDIVAFLPHHTSIARLQERFTRLLDEQPEPRRVKLATHPSTSYNEDLRAYSAQWRVRVRA